MNSKLRILAAGLLASCMASPASIAAEGDSNVMVIFDSSGSMKRAAGSETRINAAKRVVSETLNTMPGSVRTGLIAFGHRRAKDCSDIEVVAPIGDSYEARTQARMVEGFDAIGETPIAAALDRAGQEMKKLRGDRNSVVLVTDGIEECRGDPCAAADRLNALGIGVKVHVVGFALKPGESNSLQCVAQKTGGRYFDASDAEGLRQTFAEVRKIVAPQPVPVPQPVAVVTPPVRTGKVVFEEKFDGNDVPADSWEILNRNADRYIVEKGELLLVNPAAVGFQKDAVNIVRLNQEMPNGDWDIVVDAKLLFQTISDGFSVGLLTDEKNALRVTASWTGSEGCNKLEFGISRTANGEETKAVKTIAGNACGFGAFGNEDTKAIAKALENKGVRIVLMKRDRKYSATFEINDWKDAKGLVRKITTDELTSLRVPGRLALQTGKLDAKKPSETSVRIDQVQILAYE